MLTFAIQAYTHTSRHQFDLVWIHLLVTVRRHVKLVNGDHWNWAGCYENEIFCTSTVYHDLYKVLSEYVNLLLHLWYSCRTPWNLNLQDHFPKGALMSESESQLSANRWDHMKYISLVLRYKIQAFKRKITKTWPRCMEIRSNIGMDTILIKRAADMNCTWIRYSFEAAFTSTLVPDIVFETRCANYIFSDYDWYQCHITMVMWHCWYPCQLQCPTGLSSTMGLLWYISTIPSNVRSDSRRYILSLNFFLCYEMCKDISTCGFTNTIQLVRTQNPFR